MTVPSTNTSLQGIQDEFGGSNPIQLSEYYAGGSFVSSSDPAPNGPIPTSGQISMGQFRGAESLPYTLQYLVIAGGASDGTVTFRDGSVTGTTLLIAPCNANDTETLNIPDSGVLFEDGIHVVLSNIDRVTVFHS